MGGCLATVEVELEARKSILRGRRRRRLLFFEGQMECANRNRASQWSLNRKPLRAYEPGNVFGTRPAPDPNLLHILASFSLTARSDNTHQLQ